MRQFLQNAGDYLKLVFGQVSNMSYGTYVEGFPEFRIRVQRLQHGREKEFRFAFFKQEGEKIIFETQSISKQGLIDTLNDVLLEKILLSKFQREEIQPGQEKELANAMIASAKTHLQNTVPD